MPEETIGQRIKKLRVTKGLTQREFAIMIGYCKTTVNDWEGGRRNPSEEAIERIIEVYSEFRLK